MEIRDTRNGSWYWVNTAVNACPHISHADKAVYGALASFGGYKEIKPSFETIAKKSATSLRQAKISIKKLIKAGYIKIEKGGGRGLSNVYVLLKCAKGCKKCTVSKGCKKVSETVQNLHLNGAKSAPHIYIDRENRKELSFKNKFNTHAWVHRLRHWDGPRRFGFPFIVKEDKTEWCVKYDIKSKKVIWTPFLEEKKQYQLKAKKHGKL